MEIDREVLLVLEDVLSLKGRTSKFKSETPLLGAVPELDSMAVAGIITSLEDRFGLMIADDEIDGATFATVGSLVNFVREKMAQ